MAAPLAETQQYWLDRWWWNWELHVPPSDAPSDTTLDMVSADSNYGSSDSENDEWDGIFGNDYIAMMTDDEQDDDVH